MIKVVFMVRDFGIQPALLGIYTSILNASFCFCQFLCCYSWGLLSDKFGRRIALVVGLIFSTIAIVLFGLSKDFATAIIARCISGFFNGNLGVIKAYLADVTDGSNRAFAFSTLAISYGFGSVLGSMCGGIFIETNDVDVSDGEYIKTVGIIKWWIFDNEYPFLLPCIIGAIISGNALIWTLVFIRDEKIDHRNVFIEDTKDNDYQSVISEDKMMITSLDGHWESNTPKSMNELAKMAVFEAGPGDGIHSMVAHTFSFQSVASSPKHNEFQGLLMSNLDLKNADNGDNGKNQSEIEPYSTVLSLVFDTELYHGLIVWTLLIMAFMMYQEMNPVYMAQALIFTSQFIGYSMAFSGGCLLLFTYYIQPWFLKKFSFRPMCIICSIAMSIVIFQMPSIYTTITEFSFPNETTVALILAFINSMAGVCFGSIIFVATMCWVNNSVPNSCVGRANGMGQTMAALVRAIGPALTGFIWSGSVTHIETNRIAVYYAYLPSFICFVVIALWIYLYIGDDAQLMWEQRESKNKNKLSNAMMNKQRESRIVEQTNE